MPSSPRNADGEIPYAAGIYEGRDGSRHPHFRADGPQAGESTLSMSEASGPSKLVLHPDLARIAERYQRIRSQQLQGQMSAARAAQALAELVARDDTGTMWQINPRDGGWMYLGRDGRWKPGEPPKSGLATATAFSLDRAAGHAPRWDNPDHAITWTEPQDVTDPWALAVHGDRPTRTYTRPRWLYPLLVTVAVAAAAWLMLGDRDGAREEAPPVSTLVPGAPAGVVEQAN